MEMDTDPIYLLGLGVVRSKAENLCEMGKRPVHVILVVEAEAPHVNSVGVHVVELQNGVRSLGGLAGKCLVCIIKLFRHDIDRTTYQEPTRYFTIAANIGTLSTLWSK